MAETRIKFTSLTGRGLPLRGNDIDTDRIIPARFMKCVTFDDLGQYAFYDARFDGAGQSRGHAYDDPRFKGGEILVVNQNFGCGSSREHAPQALQKSGIKAIIGESFAEIFAGNCTAIGIPAVRAAQENIEALQTLLEQQPDTPVSIDLIKSVIRAGDRLSFPLAIAEAFRKALVAGTWDSTAVLLENDAAIARTAARLPYMKGYVT